MKITIDDTIAEGNEVVHHWTITGTHKGQFLGLTPTNKKATVSGTSIFHIQNSKIAEQWSDWNLMSLMEQLGIASTPNVQTNAPKGESKAHA
jgi:predicted ester cyclase